MEVQDKVDSRAIYGLVEVLAKASATEWVKAHPPANDNVIDNEPDDNSAKEN